MNKSKAVSIVVPTFNEVDNILPLLQRISETFAKTDVDYEVIFIDDHSHDGTQDQITSLQDTYNAQLYLKDGERGKATSLLQGFERAQYDVICMIDADLQYPPEDIIPMYDLMYANGADMIVTERRSNQTSWLRQLSTKVFNLLFTRLLFGFNYDSQSGLKLFKKEVIQSIELNPNPWSFDLEFIVRALENDYKILNHKINFSERYSGEAKVQLLKVTIELIKSSVSLRLNSSRKKVRASYQRNTEFKRKAYGGLSAFLVGLIASIIVLSSYSSVSATAINISSRDTTKSINVSKLITSLLSSQDYNATNRSDTAQKTTNTTRPVTNTVAPVISSTTQNVATTPSTSGAKTISPTSDASSPATTTVTPVAATTPSTTAVPATPAAAAPSDASNGVLTAATYPTYEDQARTPQEYQNLSMSSGSIGMRIALITLLSAIGLIAVMLAMNRRRRMTYSQAA